jgi:hypothetical protein
MRKVAVFLIFIILFSSISLSAETKKQMMPSDYLGYAMSIKDGTWTVKALGLATGEQGQEAVMWITDPSGKITNTAFGELDKQSNGLFTVGQILIDPVSGATKLATSELSKDKNMAIVGELAALQSAFSQLGVKDGSMQVQRNPVPSTTAGTTPTTKNLYDLKGSVEINFKNVDTEKIKPVLDSLHASQINGATAKSVEQDIILKPNLGPEITSRARLDLPPMPKFDFESKDKENKVTGDFKKGSINYNTKEGLTQDKITKADIVAGKSGIKAQINGNPPLDLPADSEIKVDKVSCTEDAKTKVKKCTTPVDVTVAQEKLIEATPQRPGMLIDDTKKDPVKVSFCGKDYSMLPGSTMKIDMKKTGDVEDCSVKEGKVLWSNKITDQNQVFKLAGGVEVTADSAKWDHQEGFMDIKKDKDGNTLIEGTMKNVKLKDGTVVNLEGQTNRGTMLMDTVKMKVSPNGDLLNMEVRAKNRDVTVSYGDVTLDKLRSGDTPFWRDVKPVVVTPYNDGIRVSNPGAKPDYILAPKVKPTSKSITVSEGLDPNSIKEYESFVKSNEDFIKSMKDRPLQYNPSSFTTSSDMKISTESFINSLTYPYASDPRYNPYVCDPSDLYCMVLSSPDSSSAGKEQVKVEDANKIKVKKDDTPWDVAIDYELARILHLSEEDKKAIKEASVKGNYLDVLQQKLGSEDSAKGFNNDVKARYDRLRDAYSTWKLDGTMEVDAKVMAEPLVTVVTSSVSTGQVVVHATNNADVPIPSSTNNFLTQYEIDKTINTYYYENYIKNKPAGMSDKEWQDLRIDYFTGKIPYTNPQLVTESPSTPYQTPNVNTPSPPAVSGTTSPSAAPPVASKIEKEGDLIPKDSLIVNEGLSLGFIPSGFYYSKTPDGNSGPFKYGGAYMERDVDLPGVTIKDPVANPGAFIYPYVKEGDMLYVYRKESDGRISEHKTVSKNIWNLNVGGVEGILVEPNTNKFFAVKKGDVVITKKADGYILNSVRRNLGIK